MTEQPQLNVFSRQDRARDVIDMYEWQSGALDGLDDTIDKWRFFGVEENTRGGFWPSVGDSVQEICDRNVNQEYAGDWDLIAVYDLDEQVVYTNFTHSLRPSTNPKPWIIETEDDGESV